MSINAMKCNCHCHDSSTWCVLSPRKFTSSGTEQRCARLSDMVHVRRELLLHRTALPTIFLNDLDNLDGAAEEEFRIEQIINLLPNWFEILGTLDTLDQIVLTALVLNYITSRVKKYANPFIGFLARGSFSNHLHNDVVAINGSSSMICAWILWGYMTLLMLGAEKHWSLKAGLFEELRTSPSAKRNC